MKHIACLFAALAIAACVADTESTVDQDVGVRPKQPTFTISCFGNGYYTVDTPEDCDTIPDLIEQYCSEYGGGGTADVPGCGFYWHSNRIDDDVEAN